MASKIKSAVVGVVNNKRGGGYNVVASEEYGTSSSVVVFLEGAAMPAALDSAIASVREYQRRGVARITLVDHASRTAKRYTTAKPDGFSVKFASAFWL